MPGTLYLCIMPAGLVRSHRRSLFCLTSLSSVVHAGLCAFMSAAQAVSVVITHYSVILHTSCMSGVISMLSTLVLHNTSRIPLLKQTTAASLHLCMQCHTTDTYAEPNWISLKISELLAPRPACGRYGLFHSVSGCIHGCAGHTDVVQYLLEAGAVCNEYTFDGDRCHYAALTLGIRTLLRQYEARPPPLSPLATSLRSLSSLCENPEVIDNLTCYNQSW